MNYLDLMPPDIIKHIDFFVHTSYANSIIYSWRRYYSFKRFIHHCANLSPKIHSFIDNDKVFVVISPYTHFYFNKLNNLITGNESYIHSIYLSFYCLAVAIDDYEWVYGGYNNCYSYNKLYCLQAALKFNWTDIIELLG